MQNTIDFPFNIENIKSAIAQINLDTGEGIATVKMDGNVGMLRIRQPLDLAVFRNGIFFLDGPFRPFSDSSAFDFIEDIANGLFPTELRNLYPNRASFNLFDPR